VATAEPDDRFGTAEDIWLGSVVAGVVVATVMAAFLTALTPMTIVGAIPARYGQSGPVVGWLVHLIHGGAFGFPFAGLAVRDRTRRGVVALGVGFGVVLWFVGAGSIMPIWLTTIGFPGDVPIPNLEPTILVDHLLYGSVIGLTVPELADLRPGGS
jgi:hypothetical protein